MSAGAVWDHWDQFSGLRLLREKGVRGGAKGSRMSGAKIGPSDPSVMYL